MPAAIQTPIQASAAQPLFTQGSRLAEKKEEHRPMVVTYGGPPLPAYMKPKDPPPAAEATYAGITYKPAALEGSKAVTVPDRNLVLTPGPITCIMDTMIVTGQSDKSPFQCHLDRDVLSPTNVTLMEAGTQVIGSYKSVAGDGQDRVVAVTASAVTPNGVAVQLGGPLADQLGAAGVRARSITIGGSASAPLWRSHGSTMASVWHRPRSAKAGRPTSTSTQEAGLAPSASSCWRRR